MKVARDIVGACQNGRPKDTFNGLCRGVVYFRHWNPLSSYHLNRVTTAKSSRAHAYTTQTIVQLDGSVVFVHWSWVEMSFGLGCDVSTRIVATGESGQGGSSAAAVGK
jgi:hypothetical protein